MHRTHPIDVVGLTADLDTISGRFSAFLQDHGYAFATARRFRCNLRFFAHWLHVRGRRVADVTLEDVPHLVRYSSMGHSPSRKEERRECLHAWLRFGGRFKRVVPIPPWQHWIDDHLHFLEAHKGAVATTRSHRRVQLARYLRWQFGAHPADWSRVGPPEIIRYVHHLAQRGVQPITTKLELGALRQFLTFLELRGIATRPLIEAMPKISTRGQRPRRAALSDKQRQHLLAVFPRDCPTGRRNYAMALCMVDLGLRACEVVALRLVDIDWTQHHIAVPPAKGGGGRTLPLPPHVLAALRTYVDRGRTPARCDRLFLSDPKHRGMPLSTSSVRNHFTRAFHRCGFPFTGAHRLRHTFASRLHARGADLKQIADLLGHRSLEATNVYAQVGVRELRALIKPWPLAS